MSALPKPQAAPAVPRIARERYADTVREAFALIRAHGEEIGATRLPLAYEPDLNAPALMERENLAGWLTVRDEQGAMIGYALIYMVPSQLFSGRWQAVCQWLYLAPERRTPELLRKLWRSVLLLAQDEGAVAVTRDIWIRKGGRHPMQVTRWTFLVR